MCRMPNKFLWDKGHLGQIIIYSEIRAEGWPEVSSDNQMEPLGTPGPWGSTHHFLQTGYFAAIKAI